MKGMDTTRKDTRIYFRRAPFYFFLRFALPMTILAATIRSRTRHYYFAAAAHATASNNKRTIASSMTTTTVHPTELLLKCSDGITLAAQSWKRTASSSTASTSPKRRRILCLHGWMDNARSFHYLAPTVVAPSSSVTCSETIELVALDIVGHGKSSHKSLDGPSTVMAEGVYYIAEALHQLGWVSYREEETEEKQQVTLIGHSMGAALSTLYTSAYPEHVNKLVLLDGAGPLARNPASIVKHVRAHVDKRLQGNLSRREPRIYPSLEVAVKARCLTAKNSPGDQWLSTEAATELILRGTEQVIEEGSDAVIGFKFRHDPRLQLPSCMYMTPEQVNAIMHGINCPTALFLAKNGWPFEEARLKELLDLLGPATFETLPGSHHFHADPETAPLVAEKVVEFLDLK
mmetsp:Transcript_13470/g.37236  ORF Transcript_13470/g.37236 Transcript_13470/m.37236 type:complete len:403 (+) Transcript_13470:35-1243(+)